MSENRQKQIKQIMEEFNFQRVHDAMVALDWTWTGVGVPSVCQLQDHARYLLNNVKKGHCNNTGGFKTSCDEEGILSLEFVLAEWEYVE